MKPACLLLAGGHSRRLGFDKRELRMASGLTLLEHLAALLRPRCEPCWWAPGARRGPSRLEGFLPLADVEDGLGPMAALLAALEAWPRLSPPRPPALLILAADLAALEAKHVDTLLQVPISCLCLDEGGRVTLPAVVEAAAMDALAAESRPGAALMATLQSVAHGRLRLPPAANGLAATFNLNTPEDLACLRAHGVLSPDDPSR